MANLVAIMQPQDSFSGGPGDDTYTGTPGADTINGNGGNDILAGGAGGDTIDGGDGSDVLYSGNVSPPWQHSYFYIAPIVPVLDTGREVDTLRGGAGYDTIFAGYGDNVDGGADGAGLLISFQGATSGVNADFTLLSTTGSVTIGGGTITNITNLIWIDGSNYDDIINGGTLYNSAPDIRGLGGNDKLTAAAGSYSNLYGGDGNDILIGGNGASGYYYGEAGDDTITSSRYADGGDGNDTFFGVGSMHGGTGNDTFNLNYTMYQNNVAYGNTGNDTENGGGSNDALLGNEGADVLRGGDGNDRLFSAGVDDGNDSFWAYGSNYGNPLDELDNGTEHDQLFGGTGDDRLSIGYGDTADGGSGINTLLLALGGAPVGVTLDGASILGGTTSLGGGTITNIQNVEAIWGTNFADTLSLPTQAFTGTLHGGGGDDHLSAGGSATSLYGDAGNDTLTGGSAADQLYGGGGADTIDGGGGDDAIYLTAASDLQPGETINGGTGTDTLLIQASGSFDISNGVTNVEKIDRGDYTNINLLLTPAQLSAFSVIHVDAITFTTGGTVSLTSQDVSAYIFNLAAAGNTLDLTGRTTNLTNGIAVNGGAGDDIIRMWSGNDWNTLNGGDGNDQIYAGGGNDTVDGGAGNDLLDGGTGQDQLTGGAGDDTYILDDMGDLVIEQSNGGNDTVQSSVTIAANRALNVETLMLTGSASIDATGDDFANTIIGNSGANHLYGNGGSDRLIGGAGADFLDGGAGIDLADYHTATAGVTVQLGLTDTAIGTATGGDQLRGIENVTGTDFADVLIGGNGDNLLVGGGGDDRLEGGLGNDQLIGGAGADIMVGGVGNDLYRVDQQGDVVFENAGEGTDTVISTSNFYLYANIENLTLASGAGNIFGVGNELANTITGNEGDNLLLGGAGADTVHGGVGADAIYGEDGNDQLYGDVGNDVIVGGAGDDMLDGGTGTDQLYGGVGNDVFRVDQQGDVVFENAGEGADTVISTSNFYLYANIENLTLASGAGNIFGVGNELANSITGNEGDNLLLGGAGADIVHGGAGADTIYGDDGNDQLYGDAGNDVVVGGAGDDVIDGGVGADQLHGGTGNDVFYVDQQNDVVFESAGEGTDTVISTSNFYLYANIENLTLASGAGSIFGVGNELANTITGNESANLLLGGDGNDVINGKGGNDTLYGQAGADRFVFEHGTGVDTVGDFVAGTDKIDLTAIGYSWQQVQNAFHQNGADLAIDLGNGDSVILHGVTASQLQQSDFVLAGGSAAVTTLTAHAAAPATPEPSAIDYGAMLSGLWHDGGHGPALMSGL